MAYLYFRMNLEFIKPQNLGSLLMKSSQSNFDLRSPSSYLVRSYLIATVKYLPELGLKAIEWKVSGWVQEEIRVL